MPTPDEVARAFGEEPAATVQPGSIVRRPDGREQVVVDVSDDMAVLREPEDANGTHLDAAPVDQLIVTGHL